MRLFRELRVIDDGEPRFAPMQMAVDEALLRSAFTEAPTLRFYAWRAPAASFGYFSRFADVKNFAPERELVRRWTGGGIVLHGADLTYSLIVPTRSEACRLKSIQIYRAVHAAMHATFAQLGVTTVLASGRAPRTSDACFANPVEADLLSAERKIAGAAQRRTRDGLLHQGSIQLPVLPPQFRTLFAEALANRTENYSLGHHVVEAAERIALERYSRAEWLTIR